MKKHLNFNGNNSILELIHIILATVTHIMNSSLNILSKRKLYLNEV